jgi:cytochrome c-type biogenesis protein
VTQAIRPAVVVTTIACLAVAALAIAYGPIGPMLEHNVSVWLNNFAAGLGKGHMLTGPRLYAIAFAGGLLASLSPCILGLLPVNLSYIGALKIDSKLGAISVATTFVAGVGTVLIVLGLASALFFAVFATYRGQINVGVGLITIVMAMWMLGWVRLSVPPLVKKMPLGAGSYVVGVLYALIASPCASPVLIAVLGAAGASGSVVTAVLAMAVYTVGYTLVLWLASVFASVAVASRRILKHGELITRIAGIALLLVGAGTIIYGVKQLI